MVREDKNPENKRQFHFPDSYKFARSEKDPFEAKIAVLHEALNELDTQYPTSSNK